MDKRAVLLTILLVLLLLAVVGIFGTREKVCVHPRPEGLAAGTEVVESLTEAVARKEERYLAQQAAPVPTGPPERGPSKSGGSRDPKPWAEPPAGYFGILSGWVVDVRTGDPIVGAKIAYGPFPNAWGATADARGWFSLGINAGGKPTGPWRLRVTATGYETWEVVPDEAQLRIELIPETFVQATGRIRGRALDRDGQPLTGVVRIVLGDGEISMHYVAVLADENGEFLLEAVEPGGWNIRHLNGPNVNIFVPDSGEVPVTIRSKRTRDQLARKPDIRKLQDSYSQMQQALSLEKRPEVRERLRDEMSRTAAQIASLRSKPRRREVPVLTPPAPDGTRIVATSTVGASRERWWTVVKDGKATFPALFKARWIFTLRLASGDVVTRIDVPEKGPVVWPK